MAYALILSVQTIKPHSLKAFLPSIIALLFAVDAASQSLISGPMLGPVSHRSALIWIQTDTSGPIEVMYQKSGSDHWNVVDALVREDDHYTHTFRLEQLEPGTEYHYQVGHSTTYHFKTQQDWAYKTEPPAFTVAAGSCVYVNDPPYDRPGKAYGQGTEIFNSIMEDRPDVMLWLGDNAYLRPADISSRSGYAHRYSHTRMDPNIQKFLPTCAHYAITDDHDYGPNNANGAYPNKEWPLSIFRLFWPTAAQQAHSASDLSSYFQWNDIDFFLLDNRSWREEPGDSADMLGRSQIDWLIQNLKASRAPFKMVAVGGQILNSYKGFENMARYPAERTYLLNRLRSEEIQGVVFLSGDRHMTELSALKLSDKTTVYDLTLSPLSSRPNDISADEPNEHRVKGTYVDVNNYGLLHFSGPLKERALRIEVKDTKGELIWTKTLVSGS